MPNTSFLVVVFIGADALIYNASCQCCMHVLVYLSFFLIVRAARSHIISRLQAWPAQHSNQYACLMRNEHLKHVPSRSPRLGLRLSAAARAWSLRVSVSVSAGEYNVATLSPTSVDCKRTRASC